MSHNGEHIQYIGEIWWTIIDCPVRKETVRFTLNSGYELHDGSCQIYRQVRCTLVPELTLSV